MYYLEIISPFSNLQLKRTIIPKTQFFAALQKLDYKLFAVPVAFLFLRIWSFVIIYSNQHLGKTPDMVLTYLAVSVHVNL